MMKLATAKLSASKKLADRQYTQELRTIAEIAAVETGYMDEAAPKTKRDGGALPTAAAHLSKGRAAAMSRRFSKSFQA
jgi:hypothetical protein